MKKKTCKSSVTSVTKINAKEKERLGAKVLLLDIETSPLVGYAWKTYDTNLIKVLKDFEVLCVAWKWVGDKKPSVLGQIDLLEEHYPSEYLLMEKVHELLEMADIVIAHNGDAFDIKKINARLAFWGFQPPSPYKTVDTYKAAKHHFAFTSNKLDRLGETLEVGRKLEHSGFDLWERCMNWDRKAWKEMKEYNKQDVELLEGVYEVLRPWMPRHPNMAVYSHQEGVVCGHCGSIHMQSRGYYHTNSGTYQRYKCNSCHGWSRLRKKSVGVQTKAIVCDRR